MKKKKILFLLNTYDFMFKSLDNKNHFTKSYYQFNNLDNSWANYFYNNLKKKYFTFKDYPNLNKKLLKKESYLQNLKNNIDKIKPDLIFSTLNDRNIDNLLKEYINVKKIIWISYNINLNELKKIKEVYNYVISSNKSVLLLTRKINFKSFQMSISTPEFCKVQKLQFQKRKNEIVFIGSLGNNFNDRLRTLLYLQGKFKITIRIRNLVEKFFVLNSINYYLIKFFPRLADYLYKKKILPFTNKLKLTNKNEVFGVNMLTELKNFKFCLNIHSDFDKNNNINARVYEALSSGCLLFNEKNNTMSKIFKHKKHVIYYNSENDLLNKLNYFKKNPEESYKIAKNGNDLFRKKYQSSKRLKDFIKILHNIFSEK